LYYASNSGYETTYIGGLREIIFFVSMDGRKLVGITKVGNEKGIWSSWMEHN